MGYACLQTVGFVALTASPWLVWKLWGKKAYNRQVDYYTYIRETIKKHCEHLTDPTYFNTNNHLINQARSAAYLDESEKVIKWAKLCRKSSMLYLAKDSTIVELVNNFYANRSNSDMAHYCKAITDHVMVKLNNPLKYSFLVILLVHWYAVQAHQWTKPFNTYLFAPGLWSSEHQAAKYCSRYGASTGQVVFGKHEHKLIQGWSTKACNFSEIRLTEVASLNKAYQSWWPYDLIMRTIYTLGKSILTTSNMRYNIFFDERCDIKLTLDPYTLSFKDLNFGQMKDSVKVSQTYDSLCTEYPSNDIVLFGPSRGAAALLNFIALLYSEKINKKVKGIVVEGCFDSLDNLTNFSYLISFFCDYRYQGISPIHPLIVRLLVNVCTAYKIPLLFVTSLKDQRVPAVNTYNLCAALKKAGMNDLYCLTLKKSTHSAYLKDDAEDAIVYEAVVHAFYQKYGLSHDLKLAQKGSVWLRDCQI